MTDSRTPPATGGDTTGAITTVCEACGTVFGCGVAQATCWCAAVVLTPAVSADLRRRYQRCLCPACLARTAGTPGEISAQHAHDTES